MQISGSISAASARIGAVERPRGEAAVARAPAPAADSFGKVMPAPTSPEVQALINKGEDRALEAKLREFENDKAHYERMLTALPEVIGHLSEQLKSANAAQRPEIELAIAGHQTDLAVIPGQLEGLMAEYATFRQTNALALALIDKIKGGSAQTITHALRA